MAVRRGRTALVNVTRRTEREFRCVQRDAVGCRNEALHFAGSSTVARGAAAAVVAADIAAAQVEAEGGGRRHDEHDEHHREGQEAVRQEVRQVDRTDRAPGRASSLRQVLGYSVLQLLQHVTAWMIRHCMQVEFPARTVSRVFVCRQLRMTLGTCP